MIDLEPELIAFPVDLQAAGIDMVTQCRLLLRAIGDSPAMSDFGDSRCSAVSSILHSASNSCSSGLPRRPSHVEWSAADLGVYAVQGTDAVKNVCGPQRGKTHMQVEHFAPETGPARHFGDAAFPADPSAPTRPASPSAASQTLGSRLPAFATAPPLIRSSSRITPSSCRTSHCLSHASGTARPSSPQLCAPAARQ